MGPYQNEPPVSHSNDIKAVQLRMGTELGTDKARLY